MERAERAVIALVKRRCTFVRDEGGVAFYELKTRVISRDDANKIQVLALGEEPPGERSEVRSVLLLGETGAGKTRTVNVMLNVLFGVGLDDPLRLEVPDQRDDASRSPTQSQTDSITAYLVYHEAGMPFERHFLLVDTPGFGDTRSPQHQRFVTQRLRKFLLEEPAFDALHCIGLVTKASENRDCRLQREMLGEFSSLLGSDVAGVTHVLATFAADDSLIEQVVRNAGVQFTGTFLFDNWPLYVPPGPQAALSPRHKANLEFRWENMAAEYQRFFEVLNNSRPISLALTRDLLKNRKLLDCTVASVKSEVRRAVRTLAELRVEQRIRKQSRLLATQIEWKRDVDRVLRETYKVMKGFHAHNCPQCDRTCIFPCSDPSHVVRGFVGAGVGVTAGAAAGAIGGIPGAAIGAVIGGASVGTGSFLYKTGECSNRVQEGVCGENGCMHDLSTHQKNDYRIIRSTVTDEVVDYRAKTRFDEAEAKACEAEARIRGLEEALKDSDKQLRGLLGALRHHLERIWELSSETHKLSSSSILDAMILEARENGAEVELLKVLKEAAEEAGGRRRSFLKELRKDEEEEEIRRQEEGEVEEEDSELLEC